MINNDVLENLIIDSPKSLDLTNEEHSKRITETSDILLKDIDDVSEIIAIEKQLLKKDQESLIFILLALKLAKSKLIVQEIDKVFTISIVFAVYKEHNRIKTNDDHPHGEDFLLRKVAQLEWLFKENPNINWEVIVVDDGCPKQSGEIAEDIVQENNLQDNVKVLYLENAIKQNLEPVNELNSINESQKGGSICYGMWYASQTHKNENDITIFTDADLSTHLGQIGLLIDPLLKKNKNVAIGSRRETDSVVIKKGSRNDRGKFFIYLWKRLIPVLSDIIDTQCGFKAFKNSLICEIIEDVSEKKFAFDIELLIKSQLYRTNSIEKVAIAWIDSEAASTTTDLQPYLTMLKSISNMYKKYLPQNKVANEFYDFLQSLEEDQFNSLLDHIPEAITSREPIEYNEYDEVSVSDLEN